MVWFQEVGVGPEVESIFYPVIKEHFASHSSHRAWGIIRDPPPTTATFTWQVPPRTGVYRKTLKCEALFRFSKPVAHKQSEIGNELRDLEAYSDLCLHSLSQNYPNTLTWPQFCKLHKWPKIPFPPATWKPQGIFINRFLHKAPCWMRTLARQSTELQLKATEKKMGLKVASWWALFPRAEKLRNVDP